MRLVAHVCALLIFLPACAPPNDAFTPMARAARVGDVTTMRRLAAQGHDVNANDPGRNHWTPLLHAIHRGQRVSVDTLLDLGADVHQAVVTSSLMDRRNKLTPLLMAVGNGQTDIVRRLLAAGADPRRDGGAIFAIAVSGGALTDIENPLLGRCNTEIVRLLLDKDPTLRLRPDARGDLVRLLARLKGCDEVVQLTARR